MRLILLYTFIKRMSAIRLAILSDRGKVNQTPLKPIWLINKSERGRVFLILKYQSLTLPDWH